MSNLTRWEPMRNLINMQGAMDRLFDDWMSRSLEDFWSSGIPAIDMYQTDEDVIIKSSLPGMKPEDLNLTITGDVVTLQGEMRSEQDEEKAVYSIKERRFGSFQRSIHLPAPVKAEKAEAKFVDGVLTLTLPKADEVRPKSITVKAS